MQGLLDLITKHGTPELKRGVSGFNFPRVSISLALSIPPKSKVAFTSLHSFPPHSRPHPPPPIFLSAIVFQTLVFCLLFYLAFS